MTMETVGVVLGGRLLAPLTGARAAGDRLAEVIHRLG
jgi:hypothetical protein